MPPLSHSPTDMHHAVGPGFVEGSVAARLDDWREKLAANPHKQQKRTSPSNEQEEVDRQHQHGTPSPPHITADSADYTYTDSILITMFLSLLQYSDLLFKLFIVVA